MKKAKNHVPIAFYAKHKKVKMPKVAFSICNIEKGDSHMLKTKGTPFVFTLFLKFLKQPILAGSY